MESKKLSTEEKLIKIQQESGIELQIRVANKLREKKMDVDESRYYLDKITEKDREIDIIASYSDQIDYGPQKFTIRLIIECKNINEPTLFHIYENQLKVRNYLENIFLDGFVGDVSQHHYLGLDVVKYAEQYKAQANQKEKLFEAWSQSVNALLHIENEQVNENIFLYPVVVVNSCSNFFARDKKDASGFSKYDKPFIIEAEYSFLDTITKYAQKRIFFIDVISESMIDDYIKSLISDIKIIKACLSSKYCKMNDMLKTKTKNRLI